MGFKIGSKNIDKVFKGSTPIDKVFKGSTEIYTSVGPWTDVSGSPGNIEPINDLDGNPMFSVEKGIAYYGTVSSAELFTSDELASAVGITAGTSMSNDQLWHKYYWNGGVHFWRKSVRYNITWTDIANAGAVYGTGTTTSRKGYSNTSVNQDAEVTKNGLTYAVRLMEGGTVEPVATYTTDFNGSEFNLIAMNLHAATNSGVYSNSPTDGITYANWPDTQNFTNDDFVGWRTDLSDTDFPTLGNGSMKWMQETSSNGQRLGRVDRLSYIQIAGPDERQSNRGWFPVLTVKDPSFTYE